MSSQNSTYSCRVVLDLLKELKFEKIVFDMEDDDLYKSGLIVFLSPRSRLRLSIQTHPKHVGRSFAVTTLLDKGSLVVEDEDLGYLKGFIRHYNPEKFRWHLIHNLLENLEILEKKYPQVEKTTESTRERNVLSDQIKEEQEDDQEEVAEYMLEELQKILKEMKIKKEEV